MKTIGLIGGMSWESTAEYYRIINEKTNRRLGDLHSAKMIIFSLDFDEIAKSQHEGRWADATVIMVDAAKTLEGAGADLILICTNTMHKMADEVQSNVKIPLLHIVDAIAEAIKSMRLRRIGLLGTRFTMEEGFYKDKLEKDHGIETIIPDQDDREYVDEVIYNELCLGRIRDSSKQQLKTIIEKLVKRGAEGIILACTELPLLIKEEDSSVPLFDSCRLHAEKAVEISLQTDQ